MHQINKVLLVTLCLFIVPFGKLSAQKLTVWHTENDPLTTVALDSIGKRFSNENPGVEVSFLSIGWDDLYRKLTLAIEGKEVPDLTQIEPFMGAYLYKNNLLQPIDDVIDELQPEDIFPAVKDLQLFDGKRYGIATALGISYYAFRKDYLTDTTVSVPKTWEEFQRFLSQPLKQGVSAIPVLLPANDLHITLLFTEFLASNGGSLFDQNGNPDFTNPRVIETLNFWKSLYQKIPSEFRNSPYKENFAYFARGDAFVLPCFFGRGTLQIERQAPEQFRTPNSFSIFPHIVGPSGNQSFATLDAEPWVILKDSKQTNLAKKFIKFFYRKENYLLFCQSVPIHLTPIFQSVAKGSEYQNTPIVKKWNQFYSYQVKMLEEDRVLPIFMAKKEDRLLTSLFKFEGTKVVATMVRDVTQGNLSAEAAANKAMSKAKELEPDSASFNLYYIFIFVALAIILLYFFILRLNKNKKATA